MKQRVTYSFVLLFLKPCSPQSLTQYEVLCKYEFYNYNGLFAVYDVLVIQYVSTSGKKHLWEAIEYFLFTKGSCYQMQVIFHFGNKPHDLCTVTDVSFHIVYLKCVLFVFLL